MGKSVADIVLEKMMKNLEEGKVLPWSSGFVKGCINWYTETEYRGVNLWLLQDGSGEYITFNQLVKYNEKKGTDYKPKKGTAKYVYWWQQKEKELTEEQYEKLDAHAKVFCKKTRDGRIVRVWHNERYYKVFDIKDCVNSDGECLPSKIGISIIPTYSKCEDVIKKYCDMQGVNIKYQATDVAYYGESIDSVVVAPRERWDNANALYRVLFHELTHSTGVERRLNRDCFKHYRKSKDIRSKEELVAEFGSVLLASECGVTDQAGLDNSEAYVTSWGTWLKENKEEILSAMRMAERATQFILNGGILNNNEIGEEVEEEKKIV